MLTCASAVLLQGDVSRQPPDPCQCVTELLLLLPRCVRLKAMYYDRKRDLIKKGEWFDDPAK